jgi:predicted metal-binding protein
MTQGKSKKASVARANKLKLIERYALEKGASRAKIFSARKVVVDNRVRMKCQIPRCPHYGLGLNCPPNVPTVGEFREALALYSEALLIQTVSPIGLDMGSYERKEVLDFFKDGETAGESNNKSEIKGGEGNDSLRDFDNTRLASINLHKIINETELQAMSLGFYYALGFIGGHCMLCRNCAGAGSPCRRPYESRPAIEGLGVDVIATSSNAGMAFDMPPVSEIVWTGLLLVD